MGVHRDTLGLVFLANGVTALLCFELFRYEAPLVDAANQQRILGQQVVLLSTRIAGGRDDGR